MLAPTIRLWCWSLDLLATNLNISKITNLDHRRRNLLGRVGDLQEKGIQERDTLPLFYHQRHQNQTKQEENDDEGWNRVSSNEKEITYPHPFSGLGRHGMKQFLVVQNHSCPHNDRRERIFHDRNGKASDLAEKNV